MTTRASWMKEVTAKERIQLVSILISPNVHFKNLPLKNVTWDFYLFPSECLWFYGLLVIVVTLGAMLLMMRYLKGSLQEPVV